MTRLKCTSISHRKNTVSLSHIFEGNNSNRPLFYVVDSLRLHQTANSSTEDGFKTTYTVNTSWSKRCLKGLTTSITHIWFISDDIWQISKYWTKTVCSQIVNEVSSWSQIGPKLFKRCWRMWLVNSDTVLTFLCLVRSRLPVLAWWK